MEDWQNQCVVTKERLGVGVILVHWNLAKPSMCQNIVLMSLKALQKFDVEGREDIGESAKQNIEARLAACKIDASV